MPTLSQTQILLLTALAGFLMLFAFQGTAAAARLAGSAEPVSTTSVEPLTAGDAQQKAADTEEARLRFRRRKPGEEEGGPESAPEKGRGDPRLAYGFQQRREKGAVKSAPGMPGNANGKLGKYVTIDSTTWTSWRSSSS